MFRNLSFCPLFSLLVEISPNHDYISYVFIFWYHPGDTVQVVYKVGSGTEPLFDTTTYYYHGFTGFRI